MESRKLYYTIGEVADMFDVNTSLIRFWEKSFNFQPLKTTAGARRYSEKEIEQLKLIFHLVKERGLTIKGAKAVLASGRLQGGNEELLQRLISIREELLQIREKMI